MANLDEASWPYLWSDEAHTAQGEGQLVFWRFAFTPTYNRNDIVAKVAEVFRQKHVTSYTIYEVFGDWDMLIRAWLPRLITVEETDAALQRVLATNSFDTNDYMVVTRTPRNWVWKPAGGEPPTFVDARPGRHLVKAVSAHNRRFCAALPNFIDVDQGQNGEIEANPLAPFQSEIVALTEGGWLRQFNPERHGVKFFITYGTPSRALRPAEKEVALRRIIETCDRVVAKAKEYQEDEGAPEVSVYTGSGTMTNFLIMAKSPDKHFYRFARALVFGLNEGTDIDTLYGSRPYTHVMADRRFMAFRDEIQVSEPEFDESLLDSDESEALEFKASLAANVNRFVAEESWHPFDEGIDEVLKAVCGLLNAPNGGRLVIGVQEIDHVKFPTERVREALREYPQRGNKVLLGLAPDAAVLSGVVEWDNFRLRLAELFATRISPMSAPFLTIGRHTVSGVDLTVVNVRPSNDSWFYAEVRGAERFYARELGRTLEYQGANGEAYRRTHPRGNGSA